MGKIGDDGMDGLNGSSVVVHCWESNDTLFIHALNQTKNRVWKTMLIGNETLFKINASGGRGGNGGNGSDGSNGNSGVNSGESSKLPGSGGSGGNGGNGGRGGNGGNITLHIHPSVKNPARIYTEFNGGVGGIGGAGGRGGKSGSPASGQTSSASGVNGVNGVSGTNGLPGTLTVSNEVFETEVFMK